MEETLKQILGEIKKVNERLDKQDLRLQNLERGQIEQTEKMYRANDALQERLLNAIKYQRETIKSEIMREIEEKYFNPEIS